MPQLTVIDIEMSNIDSDKITKDGLVANKVYWWVTSWITVTWFYRCLAPLGMFCCFYTGRYLLILTSLFFSHSFYQVVSFPKVNGTPSTRLDVIETLQETAPKSSITYAKTTVEDMEWIFDFWHIVCHSNFSFGEMLKAANQQTAEASIRLRRNIFTSR